MIYLERGPESPIAPWVAKLWYARTPHPVSRRERVLPTGQAQLIFNLAADSCTGCAEDGSTFAQPPALLAGLGPFYTLIDAMDLQEMIGVVFAPGGLRMFFDEPAHALHGEVSLEDLWGAEVRSLRDRLRETAGISSRLALLEGFLASRLLAREMHSAVRFALGELLRTPGDASVARLSTCTGLSSRRLGTLFAETVGIGPKCFARIRRFREAVHTLHAGAEPRWAELALELGYYDQAHFCNDFRAFSGMSPSAYMRSHREWANHVSLNPG